MSQGFNEEKLRKAPTIRVWLQQGRVLGAEYTIILLNKDTGEEFPLYSGNGREPLQTFDQYIKTHPGNFDPIECYDMTVDLENQVLQDVTQNWYRHLPVQTGPFTAVFPFQGDGPKPPDNK